MANKTNDIRLLKKKKKRKIFIKKLIIVFSIFGLIVIGYITKDKWLPIFDGIVYKFSNVVSTDDYKKNFPIKISSGLSNKTSTFSDRIALLNDTNLYIYKRDGELQRSYQHTMTDPVMKIVSDRVLLYDHAGTKLFVEGRTDRAFSITSDSKILYANISYDGSICIVTESDTAASDITVYNNKGNKMFFSSFKEKIVDVSFSHDNAGCIVSTISASGGEFASKQYCLDFSKNKEVWSSNISYTLPLSVSISENNSASIIGDTKYIVISNKGKELFSYNYTNKIDAWNTSNGVSAIVQNDSNKRSLELLVFSLSNKINKVNIQGEYIKVKVIENKIYLLTKTSIDIYDENGKLENSYKLEKSYEDFCTIDKYLYLISMQEINILEIQNN